MASQNQSPLNRFIASARDLFAKKQRPEQHWEALKPLLRELLADPEIREHSKKWPNCSHKERAENLLLYEDPEFGFVINRYPEPASARRSQ